MITEIGKHKVKHGDLMGGIVDLMGDDRAYIFNCDPPWGAGNLKYWQTINTRMTNAPKRDIDFNSFMDKVFELAVKYTTGFVIISYGVRWKEEVIHMGVRSGLKHLGMSRALYRSGSELLPLDVHVFSKGNLELPHHYFKGIDNTSGYETVSRLIMPIAKPNQIILDPACGLGLTARAAIESGMIFRGNEINERRLQKTIDLLKRDG